MKINIIAAIGENNELGKNNDLLTHNLPRDLKYFKNKTWGFPVIMGRKTFNSLNNKPLRGRQNIIISSQNISDQIPFLYGATNGTEALAIAQNFNTNDVFIIGGASIYKMFLPMAACLFLTKIKAHFEADVFFPEINYKDWTLINSIPYDKDEKNLYKITFETWLKK